MSRDVEYIEPDITVGQKMISAISGSFLSSLLVTPLDVVRVRLQSQPKVNLNIANDHVFAPIPKSIPQATSVELSACCREVFFTSKNNGYCLVASRGEDLCQPLQEATCAIKNLQKNSFSSTFDGLRKIARHEGFTTLWRGLSPTLVMGIPANIIYFTGYDWLRTDKRSPINRVCSDNWAPLVAGSMARIVAGTVVSPIEMLRTRMQARTSVGGNHFASTVKGIGNIINKHGYSSLWRGLTLTLWRDVPFSGVYWWGYETIRAKLRSFHDRKREYLPSENADRNSSRPQILENQAGTFVDSFIAGAISGSIASILTMPFDVGKTRRQVHLGSKEVLKGGVKVLAPEERSMPRFILHIFTEEGISGLWRGWIPRTLKVAPACAIMISCYEVGKRNFRCSNEKLSYKKQSL